MIIVGGECGCTQTSVHTTLSFPCGKDRKARLDGDVSKLLTGGVSDCAFDWRQQNTASKHIEFDNDDDVIIIIIIIFISIIIIIIVVVIIIITAVVVVIIIIIIFIIISSSSVIIIIIIFIQSQTRLIAAG